VLSSLWPPRDAVYGFTSGVLVRPGNSRDGLFARRHLVRLASALAVLSGNLSRVTLSWRRVDGRMGRTITLDFGRSKGLGRYVGRLLVLVRCMDLRGQLASLDGLNRRMLCRRRGLSRG
jgi:hypothetical protein